jgi:hypothetical protein
MVTTTETLNGTPVDEEAALLEMITKAEAAVEPGDQKGTIVGHDTESTFPAAVSSVSSAGYVYMYDTKTGDRSLTNRNMLPAQLTKKRPDGSTVFTVIKPPFEPPKGTIACYLHANHPDRARFERMGFPTCPQGSLQAEYHLDSHMKAKHKQEWALLESERVKSLERDERTDRRTTLDLMKYMMDTNSETDLVEGVDSSTTTTSSGTLTLDPPVVAETTPIMETMMADPEIVEEPLGPLKRGGGPRSLPCDLCPEQVHAKSAIGAMSKLRAHKRRVHA